MVDIALDAFGHRWFSAWEMLDAIQAQHSAVGKKYHYMSARQLSSILRRTPGIEHMKDSQISVYRVPH